MGRKEETQFRTLVIEFLRGLPNCFIFTIQQMTLRGDPDLILCLNGTFIALELKSSVGAPSKLQLYKLDQIAKAGGKSYIVNPHNFGHIKNILKLMSEGDLE